MANPTLFRFSHLSPGFIGISTPDLCNDSDFLSRLNFPHTIPSPLPKLFPQKVPRSGFFDELLGLECAEFAGEYKLRLDLATVLANKIKCLPESFEDDFKISFCHAFVRTFGCRSIESISGFKFVNASNDLKYRLDLETFRQNQALSNGEIPLMADMLDLLKEASSPPHKGTCLHLTAMSRVLVQQVRYVRNSDSMLLNNLSTEIEALARSVDRSASDAATLVAVSMAYRAIPMAPQTGPKQALLLVARSLDIARSIKASEDTDKLALKSLELTTLLTYSKTYLKALDASRALDTMLMMVDLDPFDSATHSEIGLYFFNAGDSQSAIKYFDRAIELGPPGFAMNLYYRALIANLSGKKAEAANFLRESAKADPLGVSPRLELMKLLTEDCNLSERRSLAQELLGNEELRAQLTKEEIDGLSE